MMRNTLFPMALLAMLAATFLAPPARAADPFEGIRWKVKITAAVDSDSPNDKAFDDTLIFKGSKFSTEEFVKKGFKPTDFDQRSTRGPMAGFTAMQKSDDQGSTEWAGTTTGAEITGTIIWTKKDGSVHRFDFKGDRLSK